MASRTIGPVTGATTAAAAVTTIVFYLLGLAGIDAPGEVQGAVTTLLVILAGYLVPSAKEPGDHVAE